MISIKEVAAFFKDKPDGRYTRENSPVPLVNFQKIGNLVQGNYSDIDVWQSRWTEDACAWRGKIIDIKNSIILAHPFDKFWNLGEHTATFKKCSNLFNSTSSVIWEKLDGTLIIIWYGENGWQFATRGCLHYSGKEDHLNFPKLAREVLNEVSPKWKFLPASQTYMFELIHPDNRIVTDYGKRRDMVLTGIRADNCNESPHSVLKYYENIYDFHIPKIVKFNDFDYFMQYVDNYHDLMISEGFVITFENATEVLYRVKIKTEQYRIIKRIINGSTPKNMLPKFQNNTFLEFIRECPPEFHGKLASYGKNVFARLAIIFNTYKALCNMEAETKKDFAICVQTYVEDDLHKFMYGLRNNRDILAMLRKDDLTYYD